MIGGPRTMHLDAESYSKFLGKKKWATLCRKCRNAKIFNAKGSQANDRSYKKILGMLFEVAKEKGETQFKRWAGAEKGRVKTIENGTRYILYFGESPTIVAGVVADTLFVEAAKRLRFGRVKLKAEELKGLFMDRAKSDSIKNLKFGPDGEPELPIPEGCPGFKPRLYFNNWSFLLSFGNVDPGLWHADTDETSVQNLFFMSRSTPTQFRNVPEEFCVRSVEDLGVLDNAPQDLVRKLKASKETKQVLETYGNTLSNKAEWVPADHTGCERILPKTAKIGESISVKGGILHCVPEVTDGKPRMVGINTMCFVLEDEETDHVEKHDQIHHTDIQFCSVRLLVHLLKGYNVFGKLTVESKIFSLCWLYSTIAETLKQNPNEDFLRFWPVVTDSNSQPKPRPQLLQFLDEQYKGGFSNMKNLKQSILTAVTPKGASKESIDNIEQIVDGCLKERCEHLLYSSLDAIADSKFKRQHHEANKKFVAEVLGKRVRATAAASGRVMLGKHRRSSVDTSAGAAGTEPTAKRQRRSKTGISVPPASGNQTSPPKRPLDEGGESSVVSDHENQRKKSRKCADDHEPFEFSRTCQVHLCEISPSNIIGNKLKRTLRSHSAPRDISRCNVIGHMDKLSLRGLPRQRPP